MSDWQEQALELERQIAAHPCSWCGRTRDQLPEGEQYMSLLIDGQTDRAELACDACLGTVAPAVLTRFTQKRQPPAEPNDVM